jgi:hypothetical protein
MNPQDSRYDGYATWSIAKLSVALLGLLIAFTVLPQIRNGMDNAAGEFDIRAQENIDRAYANEK